MELRPQDVVVVLKLVALGDKPWTYSALGQQLSLSASQVFHSVDRAEIASLLDTSGLQPPTPPTGVTQDHSAAQPNRRNLKEFLLHGVRYAFPAHRGGMVRGIPTAHAAPPLRQHIAQGSEPPPVWPSANGTVRGTEFSPLYRNVPEAAQRDPKLYELLTLVDAIRDGRAREREIAVRELTARIDAT